ncbi:hypothetical protein LVJ94_26770 [Pendulispora rubella]|uniref:Lipoprotein n=1 Tax=Pendulispora rubella TaxID=2741070 RepID=A0ABZ2KPD1_9BACT
MTISRFTKAISSIFPVALSVACSSTPNANTNAGDASTDAGPPQLEDASSDGSTSASDIPVYVRADLAQWSNMSAARAEDGRIHLLVAKTPIADSRAAPSYSWVDAEPDGRIARDGDFPALPGARLSPIAMVGGAQDWFMDAPSPRVSPAERPRPHLLNLSPTPSSDAGAVRPLPFLLADAFEGGQPIEDAYRARCASKDPLFVLRGFGPTAYVRAWHLATGEDVVITSNCGFTRWLKLAADGTRLAESTLADFSTLEGTPEGVGFVPMATTFDVQADGATTAVLNIQDGWPWTAVLASMGLPPQEPRASRQVVVHLDGKGTVLWRTVLTSDTVRAPSVMATTRSAIHVIGETYHRTERPGDTLEADVWIASLDATTGAVLRERVLDVEGEDSPDAAIADPRGGFVLALRTGAIQVDSGSVVTFPDVTLIALDDQLNERDRLRFGSPRADGVTTLSWLDDTRLLVAGNWDGPITHTPDAERHAAGFWATVPLGNWRERTVIPKPW